MLFNKIEKFSIAEFDFEFFLADFDVAFALLNFVLSFSAVFDKKWVFEFFLSFSVEAFFSSTEF